MLRKRNIALTERCAYMLGGWICDQSSTLDWTWSPHSEEQTDASPSGRVIDSHSISKTSANCLDSSGVDIGDTAELPSNLCRPPHPHPEYYRGRIGYSRWGEIFAYPTRYPHSHTIFLQIKEETMCRFVFFLPSMFLKAT